MATVQQTSNDGFGTSLVLTFPNPVTAGHCIVVACSVTDSASSSFTAAPVLGSSPDNFYLHRQIRRSAGSQTSYSVIWSDGDCAGGSKTITITLSGATGSVSTGLIAWAWEEDSIIGHGVAIEDVTGAQSGNSTAWSTGSFTPHASTAGAGFVAALVGVGSSPAITGPGILWTNTAKISSPVGGSALAGTILSGGVVTPVWSGTLSGAGSLWTAVGVALHTGSKSGTASEAGHGTLAAAAGTGGGAAESGHGTLAGRASGAPPDSAPLIAEGTLGATGTAIIQAGTAPLAGFGGLSASGAGLAPQVVNQWSGTEAQPSAFGYIPPATLSADVALVPAASVGGGSGRPTAGNWLFVAVGWRPLAGAGPVTISVQDDGHQWWRPGQPSSGTGLVRCAAWLQPNIGAATGIPPATVYVSPLGPVASLAVLVVEVAQLGPWDHRYAATTAYNPATRSLTMSIGVP